MKKKEWKVEGVIPAIITPFDSQEQLNESVLRKLVRRLIDAGVHGLFCLGTNGEFYALTMDEKIRIVEIVVEESQGRVPVYAGAGSPSTKETLKLVSCFEAVGVNVISLITPYFTSLSQKELVDYYKRVAAATGLPIIMYNIPARTGNMLHPKSVEKLAKVPNIVGIKDSSGQYDLILQYIEVTSTMEFSVLSGNDGLILSTLMAGGKGTVSGMANICPETVVAIYKYWQTGDYEKAEQAQRILRIARKALRLGTQPSALKAFVSKLGLEVGPARSPVSPLTNEEEAELNRIVKEYLSSLSILS